MERVTRSSALTELPARPDAEGASGFFGPGDKATGTPATVPGYEWFNMVQEEIVNVVTNLGGMELNGNVSDQMAQAIAAAIANASPENFPWSDITGKPLVFSPSAHEHGIEDISTLQDALNSKAAFSHSHGWAAISDKPSAFDPVDHQHQIEDVSGLSAALSGKADIGHSHLWGLRASRSTAGSWTVSGLTIGLPLVVTTSGSNGEAFLRVTAGSDDARADGSNFYAIMSHNSQQYRTSPSFTIFPNSGTVVFEIESMSNCTLRAYQ